jgi:hypothetical protein
MRHIPITIIGYGVAAQFLLSHIIQEISGNLISIIDPDFLGGSLQRNYSFIQSNTTCEQTCNSLSKLPPIWSKVSHALQKKYTNSSTMPLGDLMSEIHSIGRVLLKDCNCFYDTVQTAQWNPETKRWSLLCKNIAHTSDILCVCTGILPGQKDYGIPTIPLQNALDPQFLPRLVKKGDHIVVVGSSHSGTLILKNLQEIPDIYTTCIYRSVPFKFLKDGFLEGIKEESASIAESIQRGEYKNLTMISSSDTSELSKCFRNSTWIIQASGFEKNLPSFRTISDQPFELSWDSKTGKAQTVEHLYGFGACVPNESGEIGIGPFVEQLEQRLPEFLSFLHSIF